MTSQDHLIYESCKFLGGSSLGHVTTLTSLATIDIVKVEMFLIFHVTSSDHMCKRVYFTLWVEALQGKSPSCQIDVCWSCASGDDKYLICHVI